MYQAGRRIESHHKRHVVLAWFAFFLILIVAGGIIFAKYFLKSDTTIGAAPPPRVTNISDGTGKHKTFDEGAFSVKLPVDWKFVGHQTQVENIYTWKNTTKHPGPGVQQLQIYYDTIPASLGVNHVLPVQGNGNQIVPTTVSENCQGFTSGKATNSISTPSKWDGVNFLCDLGNFARDVVGTSSSDGVNVVKVTGTKTGSHRIFFAYTDNGSTPNYTIFTDVVQSYLQK